MGEVAEAVVVEPLIEEVITPEMIAVWKQDVIKMREKLFRKNWKNRRSAPGLVSRKNVQAFHFILEWCDEFGDVVGRQKERNRLDQLISEGKDVNAPENRPK